MKGKGSIDLIRLENASGNCFVAGDAKLATADAVMVHGLFRRNPTTGAGFSLDADTINASRLSLFVKENQKLILKYQSIAASARVFFPFVFLDGPSKERGSDFNWGFFRKTVYVGEKLGTRMQPTWPQANFLQNVMGYDLALSGQNFERKNEDLIRDALRKSGEISPVAADIIERFVAKVAHNKKPGRDNILLVLKILRDRRIVFPKNTNYLMGKLPQAAPDKANDFARILFERLAAFVPDAARERPIQKYRELDDIGSAIFNLPYGTINPYFADLEKLAKNPELRRYGSRALQRFRDFGMQGVTMLFYLIDQDYGPPIERQSEYQRLRPYLAGLKGLCRIADNANEDIRAAIVPELYQRLEQGKLLMTKKYRASTIHMFYNLGADPDELRKRMILVGDDSDRAEFDREIDNAQRRINCSF